MAVNSLLSLVGSLMWETLLPMAALGFAVGGSGFRRAALVGLCLCLGATAAVIAGVTSLQAQPSLVSALLLGLTGSLLVVPQAWVASVGPPVAVIVGACAAVLSLSFTLALDDNLGPVGDMAIALLSFASGSLAAGIVPERPRRISSAIVGGWLIAGAAIMLAIALRMRSGAYAL